MNKNMQIAVVVGAVVLAAGLWYFLGYKKPVNNTYSTNSVQNSNYAYSNTNTEATNTNASANTNSATETTTACQTSNLSVALANGSGAAGTYYYNLVLTNNGSTVCTITGSPKVMALDANGAMVGQTDLPSHTSTTLTVQPKGKVYANIGFPNSKNFASGVCKAMDSIRVYPPLETTGLTIANIASYQADYTSNFCQAFNLTDFSATPQ